jgi:hypothetical protein
MRRGNLLGHLGHINRAVNRYNPKTKRVAVNEEEKKVLLDS